MSPSINKSYDLNTPEGMANAVGWTNDMLAQIKDGGYWLIPRSYSTVLVVSKKDKICQVLEVLPDPSIKRVLKAGGWTLLPLDPSKK